MSTAPEVDKVPYTADQAAGFLQDIQSLRHQSVGVRMDLARLAEQLTVAAARTFATEGMGRRLRVVERCVLNIFDLYPPDRDSFLTFDECDDVAIQLHSFAINVNGLFDNLAWVLVLEAGLALSPLHIGLFKKPCRAAIPNRLQDYLDGPETIKWHVEFGKPYRDSTAHRIPLYLPSRAYTPAEGAYWQQLNAAALQELLSFRPGDDADARLARHAELEREKHALGRNSPLMALSLAGDAPEAPVYMHPQVLCDWALVNELVTTATTSIREARGWPAPAIPPFQLPDWSPVSSGRRGVT